MIDFRLPMFPYTTSDHANTNAWSTETSSDMTFLTGYGSVNDGSSVNAVGHQTTHSLGPVARGQHRVQHQMNSGHSTGPYMDVFSYDNFASLFPSAGVNTVSPSTQSATVPGGNNNVNDHYWTEQIIGPSQSSPANRSTSIVHDEPSFFSGESSYGDTIFNAAAAGVLKHVQTNMNSLILHHLKNSDNFQSHGQSSVTSAFGNTSPLANSGVISRPMNGANNSSSIGSPLNMSVSGHSISSSLPLSDMTINSVASNMGSPFESTNSKRMSAINTGSTSISAPGSTVIPSSAINNNSASDHFWGKATLGQPISSQGDPYSRNIHGESYFPRELYNDTLFNPVSNNNVLKQVESNMANLTLNIKNSEQYQAPSPSTVGSGYGGSSISNAASSSALSANYGSADGGNCNTGVNSIVDIGGHGCGITNSSAHQAQQQQQVLSTVPSNSDGLTIGSPFELSKRVDTINTGSSSGVVGQAKKPSWASVASQPAKPPPKSLKSKMAAASVLSSKNLQPGMQVSCNSGFDTIVSWENKNGTSSGDGNYKGSSCSSVMQNSSALIHNDGQGRHLSNLSNALGQNGNGLSLNDGQNNSFNPSVPNNWGSSSQQNTSKNRNMANSSQTFRNIASVTSTNSSSSRTGVFNSVYNNHSGQSTGGQSNNQVENSQQQKSSSNYSQNNDEDLNRTKPTNLWSYNGLRVVNVSSSCPKQILQNIFGKFGKVKLIERINKTSENSIWVYYDNPTSPVEAAAKLQGAMIDGVSLDGLPLRIHFAPTDDQKDLKFSRPKQPLDDKGECYYWRTTNCFSREQCPLLHHPANKNIDAQIWMKMNKEQQTQSQPISSSSTKSK